MRCVEIARTVHVFAALLASCAQPRMWALRISGACNLHIHWTLMIKKSDLRRHHFTRQVQVLYHENNVKVVHQLNP